MAYFDIDTILSKNKAGIADSDTVTNTDSFYYLSLTNFLHSVVFFVELKQTL